MSPGDEPARYDLQVHTDASPCSLAAPEIVVETAVSAGFDGIAITDHDTTEGVEAARAAAPEGFDVIPGVEVTTTEGHLLALGLESPPLPGESSAPGADPLTVVDVIHERGGVAVLAHPFDRLREHFETGPAADAPLHQLAEVVDAVEAVNSRCLREAYNDRAREFAARLDLPTTGGSDAHFPMEVGRAYTVCEGDPIRAIQEGRTGSGGRGGYLSGHAATKLLTNPTVGKVLPDHLVTAVSDATGRGSTDRSVER